MKINDLVIVSNLRQNSRVTLTKMSRKTRIPVSTLYDKLRSYEGNLVRKFTSIVNFSKLGYKTKAHVMIKPFPETKKELELFLMESRCVNSLYKVGTNFEYLAEVVCKDMTELHEFLGRIDDLKVAGKEVLFVIDDLRKEDFLAEPVYAEVVSA